jgi:formylglycine-generating enzyme required for sulfatase activity
MFKMKKPRETEPLSNPATMDLNKGGADPGKAAPNGQGKTVTVDLGGVKMEFVRIPKGKFMMGSPKSEAGEQDEDLHPVEITRDFYLGKYAVTRGQFRAFVQATGYKTEAEKGDGGLGWIQAKKFMEKRKEFHWLNPGFPQTDEHPVVEVSWNDAVMFCAWASKKAGREIRLPTEAEWEYACRAGTNTRFFFGDNEEELARYGNVADASLRQVTGLNRGIKAADGYAFTAPVGQYLPNPWGLYDMHGNVHQWRQDWFDDKYYTNSPIRDPQGPNNGELHVARGGNWYESSPWSAALRGVPSSKAHCGGGLGFRVAFRPD